MPIMQHKLLTTTMKVHVVYVTDLASCGDHQIT